VANVKAPSREVSRDRIFSDEEIAAFWQACERIGWLAVRTPVFSSCS
jgi:hypothetical protein